MVKLLHAADLHLDSAFAGLTPAQAAQRRQESRELVEAMVDYANDHGADLLLLSGDLLDGEAFYTQTGEMLSGALGRFRGQVVIAPGNHDPYTPHSIYARPIWPGNVHIFTSAHGETLMLPQYGVCVCGAAFTDTEMPPWEGFTAPKDVVSIGVLHGDVGGGAKSRYRSLDASDIARSGLTYLALGHIHKCTEPAQAGNTVWAYPGCLEGRGFDETGDKGFYFGEVDETGVRLDFIPFARHRYEVLSVDVTDAEAYEAIVKALPQDTAGDSYRIRLTGETDTAPDAASLQRDLADRFFSLEIQDKTTLRRDIWERMGEDSLRGLFLQNLRRRYEAADTEEERGNIELAARFGLDAMDGRE